MKLKIWSVRNKCFKVLNNDCDDYCVDQNGNLWEIDYDHDYNDGRYIARMIDEECCLINDDEN